MSTVNPTPDESSLISGIFTIADPQGLGIITGDAAVQVLSGANLSHSVLGEIWALADKENNGFLTRNGVAIAVRLIGYAQQGRSVSDPNLLSKPGPLATIDGISPPKTSLDQFETSLPPLTQQDKTKFLKLFVSCGPSNGLLSGDKARDIFIKSKLPYEKLSQIWNLADSKVRGSLDATDFIIGMYFLQVCLASPSFALPTTLPRSLYEQASLAPDSGKGLVSHTTGNSLAGSSTSTHTPISVARQHTGQSSTLPFSGAVRPQFTGSQAPSVSPRPTPSAASPAPRSAQGDSFPQAKQATDVIFGQLDTQHKGYIEADVAVPFMIKSGLPSTDLAQIWDLADLNNDGRLTRAGFAVAMRLINSKLAGNELPKVIPSSFTSSPTPSQLQFPNNTTLNDLDLLFDTSSTTAVQPQGTGGSNQWQPQNGGFVNQPVSPVQHPSFQQQQQQQQPQQSAIPVRSPPPPTQTFDLLGDEEDTTAAVPDHSVEIGNLQNQLSSTTRSLEVAKTEKASTEKTVQQQAEELARLQTQLATARASYEMETKLLGDLRERTLTQQADITKSREELIRAEGELSALKVERNDIQSALLRDKEEVRELQRKLKEVAAESEALKVELEKVKKDARQQKGLLAIAKKQLATAEAEKLKAHKDVEIAKDELDTVTKEKTSAEAQISELVAGSTEDTLFQGTSETLERISSPVPSFVAANIPIPSTPAPSSPPMSRQATNPFDLLILGAITSPVSEGNGLTDTEKRATPGVDSISPVRTQSPFTTTAPVPASAVEPRDEDTAWTIVDKYPPIEVQRSVSPEATPPKSPIETSTEQIFSPLREIEEESSSDSDDEQPLSIVKEKVTEEANGAPSQSHEPGTGASSSPSLEPLRQASPDLFDISEPNPPAAAISSKPEPSQAQANLFFSDEDPFGVSAPPDSPDVPTSDEHRPIGGTMSDSPPPTATIKDFDEGFNNISQKEVTFNPRFDSVFDDHFDFAKIAAEESEHVKAENPTVAQPSGPTIPASPIIPTGFGQSSASPNALVGNELPQVEKQAPLSFDDIFQISEQSTTNDGPTASAATNTQSGTMPGLPVSSQHVITTAPQVPETTKTTNPFPLSFSDETERRTTSNSSPPPQRPYSPPQRSSSPPIRPSSPRQPRVSIGLPKGSPPGASSPKSKQGSNSKLSETKSEQPSKHKISIRFFGKKDKKDKEDKRNQSKNQNQGPETQQLSPSFGEPFTTGTGTPASEDDVEPVKQLSAMGFSRSQAVAALEAHGYDVQRALNSLLGTP